jgi:hypothetical protein
MSRLLREHRDREDARKIRDLRYLKEAIYWGKPDGTNLVTAFKEAHFMIIDTYQNIGNMTDLPIGQIAIAYNPFSDLRATTAYKWNGNIWVDLTPAGPTQGLFFQFQRALVPSDYTKTFSVGGNLSISSGFGGLAIFDTGNNAVMRLASNDITLDGNGSYYPTITQGAHSINTTLTYDRPDYPGMEDKDAYLYHNPYTERPIMGYIKHGPITHFKESLQHAYDAEAAE